MIIIAVCVLGCVAVGWLARNQAKEKGDSEVLDGLVEADEDTAQAGFGGSSGQIADLAEDEADDFADKDFVLLPPPANATAEETALNELKQKLS